MSKAKVEWQPGHDYKTVEGHPVRVYAIGGSDAFPEIHGAVLDNGSWWSVAWNRIGQPTLACPDYVLAPVETPKVKYLKSIRQILEAWPTAYFDKGGDLWCKEWPGINNGIYSHELQYFGKPLEGAKLEDGARPEWIEERDA